MPDEIDNYVLVPDRARTSLLVLDGADRATLPRVRGRLGAAGVLEALRRELQLEAPFLRTAHVEVDDSGEPAFALREFDAPAADWGPPAGLGWLRLEDVEPDAIAPGPLSEEVGRWIAEQLGGPIPPARAPWARPGWLEQAAAWIEESAAGGGFERTGDVALVAQWPLSSVQRLETTDGALYFKAVFSLFGHEPEITRALSVEHSHLVPEVLAVDRERGWMLMRELAGTPIGDAEPGRWVEGLRAVATIHRAWTGRSEDLFALGVHDRTLAALASVLPAYLGSMELPPSDRERLQMVVPVFDRALDELAAGPVPETLVHGDLHPWNVMATSEAVRIFDWSDACVSHPFFDLPTYLERAPDDDARDALLAAYLEAWSDLAPADELRALAALSEPLAELHHSISYRRIGEELEPADRTLFGGESARRLVRAIDLAEREGLAATSV